MGRKELVKLLDSGKILYLLKENWYIVGYFISDWGKKEYEHFNVWIPSFGYEFGVFDGSVSTLEKDDYEIISKEEFDNLMMVSKVL